MTNKSILERLEEGVVLGKFTEQHRRNRRAIRVSDTEYNRQTVGKGT